MSGYCMRLDDMGEYEERVKLLDVVLDYNKILCVRHTGDKKENNHFHLVIYTQVKKKAFRARMVLRFDKGKGNAHMSIKDFDGNEDALSYLFHEEGAPIVLNKGFTPDDIQRFRDRNQKVQEEVLKAKGKASFLLEEEVLVECQKANKGFSPSEIAFKIMRKAFDNKAYLPNDFQLKSMVDKIGFRLCEDDDAETHFIWHIVNRALKIN